MSVSHLVINRLLLFCVSEQTAVLNLEKDKAKMAEAFLELDDNADGLCVVFLTVVSVMSLIFVLDV